MQRIHVARSPLPPPGPNKWPAVALCPSMDLVCFAGSGHVFVYRSIDWEKLFGLPTSLGNKVVAWRPDGMQLAVGNDDGSVAFVLVLAAAERPGINLNVQSHKAAITGLFWTAKRLAKPIPRLSHVPVIPTLPSATQLRFAQFDSAVVKPTHALNSSEIASSLLQGPCLDMLVCGDEAGIITFSAFGYLVVLKSASQMI